MHSSRTRQTCPESSPRSVANGGRTPSALRPCTRRSDVAQSPPLAGSLVFVQSLPPPWSGPRTRFVRQVAVSFRDAGEAVAVQHGTDFLSIVFVHLVDAQHQRDVPAILASKIGE